MANDLPKRSPGEINPYASPQVPDARIAYADAGIGVWRDGELTVMHELAVLPPFCVKTGQPTSKRATVQIFRMELSSAPRRMAVPLASWWRVASVWCKDWLGCSGFALIFFAIAATVWIERWTGWDDLEVNAVLVAGAVFFGMVAWGLLFGDPVDCVRSEGSYLWLRGADRRFLNRLPEWPYR
jgi:hypothetical protein